ncbi:MAG TPA: ABC transporter permease subunit [Gammaproteobacteria bacterium]|jgi:sodium transport system permease protein
MLKNAWTVAQKELVDHLRDGRALVSTAMYTLMGPLVVGLVVFAMGSAGNGAGARIFPVMASVFALVAAFSGSMSMAIDMIAGERERRSLLPLLMNSVSRAEIVLGKWLAASVFAAGGLLVNLLAFSAVLAFASAATVDGQLLLLAMIPALVTLVFAAAALQILVSTMCRNLKEANTYLSMLIFAVMALGMWLAFRPQSAADWWFLAPVAGQQVLLQIGFANGELPVLESLVLAATTAASTILALVGAGKLMRRDAVVYGN